MRQKVKKSVSILPEGDVKIISFISDFSYYVTDVTLEVCNILCNVQFVMKSFKLRNLSNQGPIKIVVCRNEFYFINDGKIRHDST